MTNWRLRKQLREERLSRPLGKLDFEVVTKLETAHNGRVIPMTLPLVKWLDRADKRIKALDSLRK